MTTNPIAQLLLSHDAAGPVLACAQGLSLWGGVDPDTGVIIDAHHPQCGETVTGRFLLMPSSRGSCSGSGVVLQLARNGFAPAAFVFREGEEVLTLGALIAQHLFERPIAVLRLPEAIYDAVSDAGSAELRGDRLFFSGQTVVLSQPQPESMTLSAADMSMLEGQDGPALQIAMQVLCQMGAAQGADALIDVSRGHIDGCILAHDANLDFAEKMYQMGARTKIPTTINAISVDRENWHAQGIVPDFGNKASRLADAYVKMGARPTYTCAPYLLEDAPKVGEAIGWSESNAVIYANSVLGAHTQKHPDYLDLFIAMTGRAPNTGVNLSANRKPICEVRVVLPQSYDDSLWPMLGWIAGVKSPNGIPLITGVEGASPTPDDLKALCAAFGTTSAAPLLHVRGHTPEGDLPLSDGAACHVVDVETFAQAWQTLNTGGAQIDLVAIGSPHASLTECRTFADALAGGQVAPGVQALVTIGRDVLAKVRGEGTLARLEGAGVRVIPDLCWCSITEPIFPPSARNLMTNSGKYAHYAHGLTGCSVRFASLADCARAALSGHMPVELPVWLS